MNQSANNTGDGEVIHFIFFLRMALLLFFLKVIWYKYICVTIVNFCFKLELIHGIGGV